MFVALQLGNIYAYLRFCSALYCMSISAWVCALKSVKLKSEIHLKVSVSMAMSINILDIMQSEAKFQEACMYGRVQFSLV